MGDMADDAFDQAMFELMDDRAYDESQELPEICPLCKNKTTIRNGKYGEFLGCSNFPKCKFTMGII